MRLAVLLGLVVVGASCGDSHPGAPRLLWSLSTPVRLDCGREVDLLFVVDDSASMREEQANLAANVPEIVRDLLDPPDLDGDGRSDGTKEGYRIGVVTTDMGVSGRDVAVCPDPANGDDGRLLTGPHVADGDCDDTYPAFLTWDLDDPDPSVADDAACLARVGIEGCEYEQPFAALEKALTVHVAEGGPNEGFLRDDDLLAVFVITDEDDCSAEDPSVFDAPGGPTELGCHPHADRLRPVEEVADRILALKPGRPDLVVFGAVVGVPPDLVEIGAQDLVSGDIQKDEDFERILADPRMDLPGDDELPSACDVPGLGRAAPSRRIIELAREIDRRGNNGLVQSVCQADWTPIASAITRMVVSRPYSSCIRRPLLDEDGIPFGNGDHIPCVLREWRVDDGPCGEGRIPVGEEDGRAICQICQVGDGEGDFDTDFEGNDLSVCAGVGAWRYSTVTTSCGGHGAVDFVEDAAPRCGSDLVLECFLTLESDGG